MALNLGHIEKVKVAGNNLIPVDVFVSRETSNFLVHVMFHGCDVTNLLLCCCEHKRTFTVLFLILCCIVADILLCCRIT